MTRMNPATSNTVGLQFDVLFPASATTMSKSFEGSNDMESADCRLTAVVICDAIVFPSAISIEKVEVGLVLGNFKFANKVLK
jgi:hypothetical protein